VQRKASDFLLDIRLSMLLLVDHSFGATGANATHHAISLCVTIALIVRNNGGGDERK